jgi:hypothetical protein
LPDFGDGGVDVGLVDNFGDHLRSLVGGLAAELRKLGFRDDVFMAVFDKQCEKGPDLVDEEEQDGCRADGEEHDAAAHVGGVDEEVGGRRFEASAQAGGGGRGGTIVVVAVAAVGGVVFLPINRPMSPMASVLMGIGESRGRAGGDFDERGLTFQKRVELNVLGRCTRICYRDRVDDIHTNTKVLCK